MTFARAVWTRIEAIHAVTYFAPQSRDAARAAGLKGFWMGYFAFRAAPLGAVAPGVVEAAFFNFAPTMVRRALPDAWSIAAPEELVAARTAAAADAVRTACGDADAIAAKLIPRLEHAVALGRDSGRTMFAANRALAEGHDPAATLWQLCTCAREHRGDGHVAALVAAGLDGPEAHVLFAADNGVPAELLRDNRGWTEPEWDATVVRLRERGLLDNDGALTDAGRSVRSHVEQVTDRLADELYVDFDAAAQAELLRDLDQLVDAIVAADVIPFPNPMGLPRRAAS
jgi:hypothetical protein